MYALLPPGPGEADARAAGLQDARRVRPEEVRAGGGLPQT